MPQQRPDIIPCLADPEYAALYPFMASVSAPLSFVTLKEVFDAVWSIYGIDVDSERYRAFTGAYGIQFIGVTIDGVELTLAFSTDFTEEFWQRYSFPPPNPPDCPCVARYPWPVRPLYPPPPCR